MIIIILLAIFVGPLIIAAFGAYFTRQVVGKKLEAAGNKNARLIGIITAIVSFLLIVAVLYTIIAYNFRIER